MAIFPCTQTVQSEWNSVICTCTAHDRQRQIVRRRVFKLILWVLLSSVAAQITEVLKLQTKILPSAKRACARGMRMESFSISYKD
jgi:putative exporter of polyketide antibiotics